MSKTLHWKRKNPKNNKKNTKKIKEIESIRNFKNLDFISMKKWAKIQFLHHLIGFTRNMCDWHRFLCLRMPCLYPNRCVKAVKHECYTHTMHTGRALTSFGCIKCSNPQLWMESVICNRYHRCASPMHWIYNHSLGFDGFFFFFHYCTLFVCLNAANSWLLVWLKCKLFLVYWLAPHVHTC